MKPTSWSDFIGQARVKEQLRICIESAKLRREPLQNIALTSAAGFGKSSLAQIIANEIGTNVQYTTGPTLSSIKDVIPFLLRIKSKGEILFIDEIGELNRKITTFLLPIIEDFKLPLNNKEDNIVINLQKFTLIGATTDIGKLIKPFRDRFPIQLQLDNYTEEEIHQIILRAAQRLNIKMANEGALVLARASRRTPRTALGLLLFARDCAVSRNSPIDEGIAKYSLQLSGISPNGLTRNDLKYLGAFSRGNVLGLKTIESIVGIDAKTIQETIEPWLIYCGYVVKEPKGRRLVK